MTVVFDSFNSRKFVFVDSIHEFPWTLFFVGDFLNLEVKEKTFSALDCFLELLLILDMLRQPILLKISSIIHVPPTL